MWCRHRITCGFLRVVPNRSRCTRGEQRQHHHQSEDGFDKVHHVWKYYVFCFDIGVLIIMVWECIMQQNQVVNETSDLDSSLLVCASL